MTIGRRIGFGFAIIVLFFLIINFFSLSVVNESQRVNRHNSEIYVPSMSLLMEFNNMIINSEKLIANWIFVQSADDTRDKNQLREINNTEYPELRRQIEEVAVNWEEEQQEKLNEIFKLVDDLFLTHKFVMDELDDFASYDDPMVVFEIRPMMEPGGEIVDYTRQIVDDLEELINIQQANVAEGNTRMTESLENYRRSNFAMIVILILGGFVISSLAIRNISRPITSIRDVLDYLGQGKLPESNMIKRSNNLEIRQMADAMEKLINGLKEKASFAKEIGQGNFDYDYKPQSEEDILGLSLLEMRKSLQDAAEEEKKRQVEDEKRTWTTQGIAKFSELVRQNNDNIQELSFNLIKNLVKYLDANQGGIFILSDEKENDEEFVELTACYAYERRKYKKKKIFKGEGLVGTCLQEGETIFISDVPDSYISITSGLGDSNPRSILIVPLKVNDEILGVIELASFNIFESYQIEFVEKVGETIASTISSVKINIRTNELLKQSQEQSEQMQAQEEEMRQNMEEMHATQEEMERKEVENQEFYSTINSITGIVNISTDGTIKNVNQVICDKLNYNQQELLGQDHKILFDKNFVETASYKKTWDDINNGNQVSSKFKLVDSNNQEVSVKGTLGAIKDKYESILRLIFIITEFYDNEN